MLALFLLAALPDRIGVVPPTALIETLATLQPGERRFVRELAQTLWSLRDFTLSQSHPLAPKMRELFHRRLPSGVLVPYVLTFAHNNGPYEQYTKEKFVVALPRADLEQWSGDATIARFMTEPAFEPPKGPPLKTQPQAAQHLRAAAKLAQKEQLEALADYFETGNLTALERAERAFIRDRSRIKLYAGYVLDKLYVGLFETAQRPAGSNLAFVRGLMRVGAYDDPGLHLEQAGQSLNVIPLDPPDHPWTQQDRAATYRAFVRDVGDTLAHQRTAVTRMLVLHEQFGHPSRTLGMGDSPEELRANLVALGMLTDPVLERAWINQYIALIGRTLTGGQPVTWPHLRAGLFLINYWLEQNAVVLTDVFAIEPARIRAADAQLLRHIDRIADARDQPGLDALYAKYAPTDPAKSSWVAQFKRKAVALPGEPLLVQQPFHFADDDTVVPDGDPSDLAEMAYLLTAP